MSVEEKLRTVRASPKHRTEEFVRQICEAVELRERVIKAGITPAQEKYKVPLMERLGRRYVKRDIST